jgi:hypothetical protein
MLLTVCQSYSQSKFSIKSGFNISTIKDLIQYPENRLGYYGGVQFAVVVKKKLLFQPEILYSSKGYKTKDLAGGRTIVMRLNYLTLPLLLGYMIDSKTKLLVGGELGYLVEAKVNRTDDAINSFSKRLDAGLLIGISYSLIDRIGAEIRYDYGFKGFYQNDAVGQRRGELLAGNRAFQMGIFYTLRK